MGVHPRITAAQARASELAGTTVPEYTATQKVGTKSFTYTIVGKNPAIKVTNASTTVKAEIVPLIMKFSNGDTWDPTKADSCDPGASALARTQNSPIVKAQAHSFGGTSVGNVQVTNAFQRAEFWKDAQASGINPSYGVKLTFKTLSPVTINVPNADAAFFSGTGCGNNLLGAAEINWLDNHIQTVVIPSLKSQGVGRRRSRSSCCTTSWSTSPPRATAACWATTTASKLPRARRPTACRCTTTPVSSAARWTSPRSPTRWATDKTPTP